ncbi:hypothetical protein [Nocardia panacis]|uniref:hypothetical protein n=1 Tax=Nocardia panacis TaxID=2340916 RepID=UPI0013155D8A|nr:hypothetical protein [Nocardia panacis]
MSEAKEAPQERVPGTHMHPALDTGERFELPPSEWVAYVLAGIRAITQPSEEAWS